MTHPKRAARLAGITLLILGAGVAQAQQEYPSKPIRLIIPFAAGGGTDVVARMVANKLAESFRQPVVADNRGGGGGLIGMDMTARATPDGYTMGVVSGSLATNAAAGKLSFNAVSDISPISVMAETGFLLTINPSLPVKTTKDLVAYAKSAPGKLNYGSSGIGATSHLVGELFDYLAGTKMVHVPYKSTGPALTDLLGGQIQLTYGSLPVIIPYMANGRLRVLGITTAKRNKAAPDVPTIAESGVPGYEASTWYGLIGPKGLPRNVLARWEAGMNEALKSKDVEERFRLDGLDVPGIGARYFADALKRDVAKWTVVFRKGNIKL